VNECVSPARAHVYIQRSGATWLLADGPFDDQDACIVYVAASSKRTDAQADALAVVEAVLGARYGLLTETKEIIDVVRD